MSLQLKQDIKLSQQLVMTPQLQQAIRLLQYSRLELQETIQQSLMENPLLEEKGEHENLEQVEDKKPAEEKFEKIMGKIGEAYEELKEIAPKEDARFVLPNAGETKIILTMNARSLKNFFKHRTCTRAQWEIRDLAQQMLDICKETSPILFEEMGPDCITEGICPEGTMNCGYWKNIDNAMIKYKGQLFTKEGYDAERKG